MRTAIPPPRRTRTGSERGATGIGGGNRPLTDRIPSPLRVLFVGINPGLRSASVGHHFAGPSNRFWRLMHESGLVPVPLSHEDDARLAEWGYGLTNIISRPTTGIDRLRAREYAAGRRSLMAKIRRHRPAVVALVGVTIYRAFFPDGPGGGRKGKTQGMRRSRVALGLKAESVHGARVFLLPNPSGRNASVSYEGMLAAFQGLKEHLDSAGPSVRPRGS